MPVGPLPSPGPFGRIVDVRVWPHGFSTRQTNTAAGPAGSAIVRPNLEDADWHTASAQKWGGNIVWTGSTPRHTIAYNGPSGRYWGAVKVTVAGPAVVRPWRTWFSHNGAKVDAPSGQSVLGAALRVYDDLPTTLTYAGTGTGALTVQSPSTALGALTGDYEVRCIEAGATPRFLVTGPDAQPIGVAEAGAFLGAPVLFDSLVRFTLQSGAVAFVVGDAWTLNVEEAEQFVIITQNIGGPTAGPDPSTDDRAWRRGVSDTGAWKNLANFGPGTDEFFPVTQPWFINASCTKAVTMRMVESIDPGFTQSGYGRKVEIDLVALTRTETNIGPFQFVGTQTTTGGVATHTYPHQIATALRFCDFVGDTLVECVEETEFSYSFTTAGTGALSVKTTLTIGGWSHVVHEETQTEASRVMTHSPLHQIAIAAAGVVEVLVTDGAWEASVAGSTYTASEESSIVHMGSVVASRSGSGTYTDAQTLWLPWSEGGDNIPDRPFSSFAGASEPDGSSYPLEIRPGPTIQSPSGALRSVIGFPICYLSFLATNNRHPANVGGTFATDARGNLLSAIEVPTIEGTFQPSHFFPMMSAAESNGAEQSVAGAGAVGSGTFVLATAGPDALTPSLVATLTGYAPHDRWDVGAF